MLWTAAAVLTVTIAIGLVATFLVRRLALRIEFTDRPDGHRKLHVRATPLGGGVAVFGTSIVVLAGLLLVGNPWQEFLQAAIPGLVGLLIGSSIVVAVGVLDDSVGLRGQHKLLGQILASAGLVLFRPPIQAFEAFGFSLEVDWLVIPLVVLGLIATINSINLLDGTDGLASSIGIIVIGTVTVLAFLIGHYDVAILGLVFAASLLAFLCFNFPPASMFLGDTGSMLIGLIAGALTFRVCSSGTGTLSVPAALALWTVPLFDTGAAILRRTLTGRSIYTTDRGHLHHQLILRCGNKRALLWIAACVALTAASALLSVLSGKELIGLLGGTGVMAILIGTRTFGSSECQLLITKIAFPIGVRVRRALGTTRAGAWQTRVRLQGTRDWDVVWAAMLERAEALQLSEINLDLNIPSLGEGYHAEWRRHSDGFADRLCRFDVPLVLGGRPAGSLRLAAPRETFFLEFLQHVLDTFESSETTINLWANSETVPLRSVTLTLKPSRLASASPVLEPISL